MPGGNRKGPEGKGSMTGRGLGYCTGSDVPGSENEQAPRRGLRGGLQGRGGRGFRNIFRTTGKTFMQRRAEEGSGESSGSSARPFRGRGRGRCDFPGEGGGNS